MSSPPSFLENYSLAEPTVRKLYDSKLRLAILDALSNSPMRLADLKNAVKSNAPNTSAKAKELEEMGLIERIEGDYALTPYGRAVRSRAQESFEFYATYEKFKEFWDTHITTGIPDHLWARLGELNDSVVVKDLASDVTHSHDVFVELLDSINKRFYGISPIYHSEYLRATLAILEKRLDAQLIVNKEIFKVLTSLKGDQGKQVKELCDRGKWFVFEGHLSVAFTVSECFMSLALESKNDPTQYMNMDFESTSPRAIQWGLDLFDYYKKQSTPVKLSDYL